MMKMCRVRPWTVAAAVGVCAVAGGAASGAVIDSFTTVSAGLEAGYWFESVDPESATVRDNDTPSDAYGGWRIALLGMQSAVTPGLDRVSLSGDPWSGAVALASTAGADGRLLLEYRNLRGDAPIDLGAEAIEIDILAYDAPAGAGPLAVGIYVPYSRMESAYRVVERSAPGAFTLRFDLSGASFREASEFVFDFDTPRGGDIVIGEIRSVPLPEPATATLLLAAGVLAAGRRREPGR